LNLWDFERIDWDDEEDDSGNLAHCLERGIDEVVVDQVLSEEPIEIKLRLVSAEFAIVGPDKGAGCGPSCLTGRSNAGIG